MARFRAASGAERGKTLTGPQLYQPSIPAAWIRYTLAAYTALYGAVLLLPLDTFVSSPTFAAIGRIIAEPVLGVLLCLLGGGMVAPPPLFRRVVLAFAAAFWVGMAVLAVLSNPSTPAWINYGFAAATAAALVWGRV